MLFLNDEIRSCHLDRSDVIIADDTFNSSAQFLKVHLASGRFVHHISPAMCWGQRRIEIDLEKSTSDLCDLSFLHQLSLSARYLQTDRQAV